MHVEVSWDDAWAEVARRLGAVVEQHGPEAIGVYVGNPNAHNLSFLTHGSAMISSIGTRAVISASTVNQMPRHVVVGYLFGSPMAVPVPDIDRTDLRVVIGANPFESNGSLCTALDWPGRLQAIRERGGRVVVIDPRRTKTAQAADEWLAVRPGTDVFLLVAIVNELFATGAADPGPHVVAHLVGLVPVWSACPTGGGTGSRGPDCGWPPSGRASTATC